MNAVDQTQPLPSTSSRYVTDLCRMRVSLSMLTCVTGGEWWSVRLGSEPWSTWYAPVLLTILFLYNGNPIVHIPNAAVQIAAIWTIIAEPNRPIASGVLTVTREWSVHSRTSEAIRATLISLVPPIMLALAAVRCRPNATTDALANVLATKLCTGQHCLSCSDDSDQGMCKHCSRFNVSRSVCNNKE